MHATLEKLNLIKNKVNQIIKKKQLKIYPKIIVVTKTFAFEKIIPLLDSGHLHYGENKVQEAEFKWANSRNVYKDIKLHMIGKLQSNKAKKAVQIFDYIHSLDNERLALKLHESEKLLNKKVKFFIQLNFGEENQKSGILLEQTHEFYNYCVNDLSLNVIGLMCIPPISSNPIKYFTILKNHSRQLNLKELSMGMSSDFESAVEENSTFLRLGTAIFGQRKPI
jgi:PLP dependent protein